MSTKRVFPYCRSAIWGGCAFKEIFDSPLDTVAEAWVWSTRAGEDSVLPDGTPLRVWLQGEGYDEKTVNSLLIKLLDARDVLSVQVHPNDEKALLLEGESRGKTEMWYILSADEGAYLYAGLSQGKAPFEAALSRGDDPTPYLKRVYVKAGDVVYIPAGTVHAIGAGIRLLEVQQNSDTTYRVWDFARRDKEGNLRPLHTEKALLSTADITEAECERQRRETGKTEPLWSVPAKKAKAQVLACSRFFRVERLSLTEGTAAVQADAPLCGVVTQGTLTVDGVAYPTYTPLAFQRGKTAISGTGELVLCGL